MLYRMEHIPLLLNCRYLINGWFSSKKKFYIFIFKINQSEEYRLCLLFIIYINIKHENNKQLELSIHCWLNSCFENIAKRLLFRCISLDPVSTRYLNEPCKQTSSSTHSVWKISTSIMSSRWTLKIQFSCVTYTLQIISS